MNKIISQLGANTSDTRDAHVQTSEHTNELLRHCYTQPPSFHIGFPGALRRPCPLREDKTKQKENKIPKQTSNSYDHYLSLNNQQTDGLEVELSRNISLFY